MTPVWHNVSIINQVIQLKYVDEELNGKCVEKITFGRRNELHEQFLSRFAKLDFKF